MIVIDVTCFALERVVRAAVVSSASEHVLLTVAERPQRQHGGRRGAALLPAKPAAKQELQETKQLQTGKVSNVHV